MKVIITTFIAGFLMLNGFVAVADINTCGKYLNHPPNDPEITGPSEGKVGISYLFTIRTEDPENQNVSYFIEWGDGKSTGWTPYFHSGQEVHYSHTWYKINQYPVRCKAKDIYNAESNWSYMEIPIVINKVNNYSLLNNISIMQFLERLFEWFPHMFLILHFLMNQ